MPQDAEKSISKEGKTKTPESQKRLQACQWRALVAIRTQHIKGGSSRINRYRVQGGLPPLMGILKRPDISGKTLDLSLSILANCCTEKEARTEVRKLDGISVIVDILKRNVAVDTVKNRAARALGNLAMDPEGSSLIHSAGGVPPLLLCLSLSPSPSVSPSSSSPSTSPYPAPSPSPSSTSSPPSPSSTSSTVSSSSPPPSSAKLECAQSAARALLYLADTPANRLSLLSQGALSALVPLLVQDLPSGLRRASLRTLHDLTRSCGAECAREISRSGALAQLGFLISEEETIINSDGVSGSSSGPLEELALKTLANLCSQGCLRPLVGSSGAIPKFVKEVKRDPAKSSGFLRALCLCCKEAVNRVKVKDSGGLEVLIGFLSAHPKHPLTRLAILACVDFVYDEVALEQLQDLGLIPLLVSRLVEYAKGEELGAKADSSPSPLSDLMSQSCFESFDFPQLDGNRKEDLAKEQGAAGSSSFLSLRSWLVSEGLISSEGELQESPAGMELDCSTSHASSPSLASPPVTPILPSVCSPPTSFLLPQSSDSSGKSLLSAPNHVATQHSSPRRLSASPTKLPSNLMASSTLKPVSPSKVCSPAKRKVRVSSSSSSLSSSSSSTTCSGIVSLDSPPSMSRVPFYQHPYHPEPWAPESPILLLLSRFSHASDPSQALVNAGVLSGLLYYLSQHKDPSGRCFRMLSRLSCNPNCLQALLRTGAVAFIHLDLCHKEAGGLGRSGRRGAPERQTDRVKAKVRQLGLGLLANLRVQCEAGFGTGVLSHVMLSGVEVDRLYGTLSLPLICSNKVLLKKLLLDNGSLSYALELLKCDENCTEDHNHLEKCKSQLSGWICPSQEVTPSQLHSLYSSLLIGCLSNLLMHSKVEPDQKKEDAMELKVSPVTHVSPHPATSLLPLHDDTGTDVSPLPKRPRLSSSCAYADCPHDVFLCLDDCSQVPASRSALAGGEDESGEGGSEYFRVLLTGGFGEAIDKEASIAIGDVGRGMLIPVLHYLHGCRLKSWDKGPGEQDTMAKEQAEETAAGCPILESLSLKCGGSTEFQKTALGEAMVGACRFLVTGLQRATEELCVTSLQSFALTPLAALSFSQRPLKADTPEDVGKKTKTLKIHQDGTQNSPLSSKISKSPLKTGPKSALKPVKSSLKIGIGQEVPATRPKGLHDTPMELSSSSVLLPGAQKPHISSLALLLPQLYSFSQHFNYPHLGRTCLMVLLRKQRLAHVPMHLNAAAAPLLPLTLAAQCLLQLAREMDCEEALKQDLLGLVTAALS